MTSGRAVDLSDPCYVFSCLMQTTEQQLASFLLPLRVSSRIVVLLLLGLCTLKGRREAWILF